MTLEANGGIQTLPDGTRIMINQPMASLIRTAAPVPVREVIGAPDWVNTERYDVTTRPPAGSTPAQRQEMTRRMFIDRMKLVAHVEERERDTFALVVARSDGRLGPNLKPSTLDCSPRESGAPLPPPPADIRNSCGMMMGPVCADVVSGFSRTFLEPVNGSNVRMIQRGERACFAIETGQPLRILREEQGQYLDSDFPAKTRVSGAIDLAHSPAPSKLPIS